MIGGGCAWGVLHPCIYRVPAGQADGGGLGVRAEGVLGHGGGAGGACRRWESCSRGRSCAFLRFLAHDPTQWDLAVFLNRIILPAVFFIGLAAVAAAMLNSFHVFGLPASTSIFFNLVMILFSFGIVYRPILRMAPERFQTPAVALAFRSCWAGSFNLAMQIPALARLGMRFRPEFSLRDPGVRKWAA